MLPVKVVWGPGLGNPTAAEMQVQGYHAPQGVFYGPQGVERVEPEKIGPLARGDGRASGRAWRACTSRRSGCRHACPAWPSSAASSCPRSRGAEEARRGGGGAPGRGGEAALLFVGPKDHALLTGLDHDLAAVVPVGDWIGPIVIPLIALLRWVHGGVGNYGWSIVVLTVLINLLMAPLRHYSHRQRHQDGPAGPGDARHPGALPQGPRPRPQAAGDAEGDRRPLRAPRHEHEHADAGGLPAPPADHAVPDRVLPRPAGRHRAAGRLLPVDPRPQPERSALHHARC